MAKRKPHIGLQQRVEILKTLYRAADILIMDEFIGVLAAPQYGDSVTEFDVRTSSAEAPARSLSGGNQQKIIIAREFSANSMALIASQPTRGVDIGAIVGPNARVLVRPLLWAWRSQRWPGALE